MRLLDYRSQRDKILLKPNLVASPRWLPMGGTPGSAITDIRFIEALLRVFDGYEITACCDLMSIPLEQVRHLGRAPHRAVGGSTEGMRQRFYAPREAVVANVHFHAGPTTCSRCPQSPQDGMAVFWRSPYHLLRGTWSCMIKRTDVITGQVCEIPSTARGRLVCYGDCTRELAEKCALQWIPGCPPSVEEHLKIY